MKVTIYTDGSARGNPEGPGGYGTVLQYIDPKGTLHEREYSAGYKKTTNNRMELMAAIAGLEALIKPCRVELVSDSKYLVDAFEMTSGEAFDWNNSTMKANPYANRDPRLAMTVVYNGMEWPASQKIEIWEGGANGLPLTNATTTGYYLRKYVNKDISFASGSQTTSARHNWVLFRYAEVLLNYAEAMVNAFHNPDYTDAEFPLSARDAVNQIRQRFGCEYATFGSRYDRR